jgi:hypothetical protein
MLYPPFSDVFFCNNKGDSLKRSNEWEDGFILISTKNPAMNRVFMNG